MAWLTCNVRQKKMQPSDSNLKPPLRSRLGLIAIPMAISIVGLAPYGLSSLFPKIVSDGGDFFVTVLGFTVPFATILFLAALIGGRKVFFVVFWILLTIALLNLAGCAHGIKGLQGIN